MVRDTSTDNNDDSFILSTPLRANFQINIGKIMSAFSSTASSQHQDDFTFLQPFQSERLNKNLNQLKSLKSKFTSSLRSQPYTLNKPTSNIGSSSASSENGSTLKVTGNALKARMSSMSATLKTLLYKPKLSEKVDISSLSSKAKQQQQRADSSDNSSKSLNNSDQENQQEQMVEGDYLKKNETVNDYLLKLTTSSAPTPVSTFNEGNYLSDKIKKLSKEYDELIKTNQQQQQQQKHRLKNHNGSNILMAANDRDDDRASTTSSFHSYKSARDLPKWTCLICLNKNRDPIDLYCTICGSAKTSSSTHSYASSNSSTIGHTFTKPSFQRLTNKSTSLLHANTSLLPTAGASSSSAAVSPSSTSSEAGSSSRKFTKTWLCQHCDYANDNLKIVCINCRMPKSEIKMESISLSPQIKRKNQHDTASVASSNSSNCSSSYCGSNSTITITKLRPQSNENNNSSDEINQPSSKRSKDNNGQLCSSCQHPIETTAATTKSQLVDLITPTKPANMLNFTYPSTTASASAYTGPTSSNTTVLAAASNEDKPSKPSSEQTSTSQPSLASLFNNNKWNCKTCLAPNPNDKDKCACCETPRETAAKKPPSETPLSTSTATTTSSQPSLASMFSNSNKWNCKTCLAQNPTEKDKCACCETPREGDSGSSKPDPFSSKSANFGLSAATPTISVQFGSKTPSAGPIKFGSSFSIPTSTATTTNETKTEFSFGSKAPLTSAATILIPESSSPASKPLTFSSNSAATSDLGGFRFGAASTTAPTEAPKQTFGVPAASTVENKLTFGAASSTSPPSAKLPAFGSGSTSGSLFGSGSNSGGLMFGSPKTNSDNKQTNASILPQSNNGFPGFIKPQEPATVEQPKQQQTSGGLFSSASPAAVATTAPPAFGSLFGSSSGFSSSNATTTNSSSLTTSSSTITNAPSLFGNKASTTNLFGSTSSSSNPQPTTAPFTFGAATSGGNGLFGASNQQSTTQPTTATATSLFGTNTLSNSTSGNPFGTNTSSTSNTFGTAALNSNSFGTNNNNTTPIAFGASGSSSSGFGSATGGSIFGSSTTPATSTATSTAPTFSLFNSASSNATATSTTNTNAIIFNSSTKPPAFTFGASTSTATNNSTLPSSHSSPAFGLSNTATSFSGFGQPTSTNTSFFGNQNDAPKQQQQQQTVPPFTFGASSTSTPSSTPFVFGASSTNNDQQSQGQKRTSDQAPQQQPQVTGFNFGQSLTTASMNFTNTPGSTATGSSPFVFTSGDAQTNANGQQTPRVYKKAPRKLGKK